MVIKADAEAGGDLDLQSFGTNNLGEDVQHHRCESSEESEMEERIRSSRTSARSHRRERERGCCHRK
jgi:hypothetical protein